MDGHLSPMEGAVGSFGVPGHQLFHSQPCSSSFFALSIKSPKTPTHSRVGHIDKFRVNKSTE